MPSAGLGVDAQVVANLPWDQPESDYNTEELLNVAIRAIAGDRLYLAFRWRTPDGILHSLAVLNRWTGDRIWHIPSTPPNEVVAGDGVDYVLAAVDEETMALFARSRDENTLWRADLDMPTQHIDDGVNLVPAGDALYVSTSDGIAEIERESGERRRTLPGMFAMVNDDAVFTFGADGPLSKFPRDGTTTTPEWERTPDAGTNTTGAVANGQVYVTEYNSGGTPDGNIQDNQIRLHAYDASDGTSQWSNVLSESSKTSVDTVLPGFGTLFVRQGYVMGPGNQGLVIMDAESGEQFESRGSNEVPDGPAISPLSPFRMYRVGWEDLQFVRVSDSPDSDGRQMASLPDPVNRDNGIASALYGRGVLYVATTNGVYGISGTLPPSIE